MWLVRVLELEPPAGQAALKWLLASSEGAATAEWAERIVGWYKQRWAIEEYFRLLKTGTRIEDRRLWEADALAKCLAFDAITAWQVFSLARDARDAPQTRAEDSLTQDERAMIGASVERRQLRPAAERGTPFGTDIRSWVVLLGRMVGWRPSKRQPYTGNEMLWGAYVRLETMVLGMQSCVALDRLCPGVRNAGPLYGWSPEIIRPSARLHLDRGAAVAPYTVRADPSRFLGHPSPNRSERRPIK